MDKTQLLESEAHRQLMELFADLLQLDPGEVRQEIRRADYDTWDSVNHLRLIMDLEQTFGIALTDEDILSIESLQDAVNVLLRHGVDAR